MIAAGQERRRPLAVPDHGDRDHHRTPRRIVARIGQAQEAVLHAVLVVVDRRSDRRWPQQGSVLHEQPARIVAERLGAGGGDLEALGDLEPPVVLPDRRDQVKAHAFLEHGAVARAQAHGALAPVRRVAEADRVAAAALLLDAVAGDDLAPGRLDALAGLAGPCRVQCRVDPLQHRLLGIEELLRRRAEIDRARERAVVAAIAAGDLEEGALVRLERPLVPGEMRGRGIGARTAPAARSPDSRRRSRRRR